MDELNDKEIMVLDTEYETMPRKRMLSIAYVVYKNGKRILKKNKYIKYPSNVFKVNENSISYKYHGLTNNLLQEKGKSIAVTMNAFYNDIQNIDIIVGQNIMSADIQLIRKESIGTNLWFDNIRPKLLSVDIYDTMTAFKKTHPGDSCKLNDIYKHLTGKEMKNHHKAINDCKNTYTCFKSMYQNTEYNFCSKKLNYAEDSFEIAVTKTIKCSLCENKIPNDNIIYKLISDNNMFTINKKNYKIINSGFIKKNDKLCKRCFSNIELIITNNDDIMLDIVKLNNKYFKCYINKLFEIIGEDKGFKKQKKNVVYLISDYKDKKTIKDLGAKWNFMKKCWYIEYDNIDTVKKFSKWIPDSCLFV